MRPLVGSNAAANAREQRRVKGRTFLSRVDIAWQQAGDALVVPMAALICARPARA